MLLLTDRPILGSSLKSRVIMAKLKNELNPSRWLCLSCHDWACNCRIPFTVSKYNFGHTARGPAIKSTVYERTYMSSTPLTWADSKKTPEQILAASRVTSMQSTQSKASHRSRKTSSQRGCDDNNVERDQRDVLHYEEYFDKLSRSPITARKPFLVSSAHWASRHHTQHWPWSGKTQCRLWSSTSQFDLARTPRHSACWHSHKQ